MERLPSWCRDAVLLGADAPIPVDRPFTRSQALRSGVTAGVLRRLLREGLLRRILPGVLVATQVQDSLAVRIEALRLVVPEHAVVVDRLAAWVHGLDVLPRSAIHELPDLDVFSRNRSRMRRPGVNSGIRDLTDRDLVEIDGIVLTSRLRTACDLGRRLWRFDALDALDGFRRLGLDHGELLEEVQRFKGYRGVVQLRLLAPLADPRPESMPESALRLHWIDAALPPPEPQIWVYDDDGRGIYRIDLGHRETRYGAEYFGEEFHDEDDVEDDESRLAWLRRERGWELEVFRKEHVYGDTVDAAAVLRAGFRKARATLGSREVTYIDLARR